MASPKPKIDTLPKAKRDDIVRAIVLGNKSMFQVAKDLGISDTSVARYMRTVTPEERLSIVANAAADAKMAEAMRNAELVQELGEDTEKDLKWVLTELKTLLHAARGDEDLRMQLGTLKEVRNSLMALAEIQGKLSRKIDVTLNLNESPQFLELRRIILRVLERHPDARRDFLDEMRTLRVVEPPTVPVIDLEPADAD